MNLVPQRGWIAKFRDAFRGLGVGVRGHSSFLVHFPFAVAVLALAAWLRVSRWEACLLLLCVAAVLAAELFNSAIEELAREVDSEFNPGIGRALDIASAAVLVAASGAAVVGLIVFWPHLGALL